MKSGTLIEETYHDQTARKDVLGVLREPRKEAVMRVRHQLFLMARSWRVLQVRRHDGALKESHGAFGHAPLPFPIAHHGAMAHFVAKLEHAMTDAIGEGTAMPDPREPSVDIRPIEAWKRRHPKAAELALRIVTEIKDYDEVCLFQGLGLAGHDDASDELHAILWLGAA